ncbi:MAG: rhamnogalacturonan acetylesterase, partial [Firmicutes bacterium]|nr:rhamnogalacturonan acetylesterase [Bacillota bacterium]
YGIGYKYYSIDEDGYFNPEDDFDKFDKNIPAKWGVGTFVTADAARFKAEGITFEASFNKYLTTEEIKDGAEVSGVSSIKTERTLGMDVRTKTATERSTAIAIESDDSEFRFCNFIGSQDTLYIGGNFTNDVYFKNCVIEGNTDYIFGSGDAVFDGCELRFCGYTDKASGGYITAARSNNYPDYHGYLFRGCTITNAADTLHEPGYFGRPWDVNAQVFFFDTQLQNEDAIKPEGWTSMSGVDPDKAHFAEYGTTYAGKAVNTKSRTKDTVKTEAPDPREYFGEDWTPEFYEENNNAEFTVKPYFSTDGDVAAPATGDTFTVKYALPCDASRTDYYAVDENGDETFLRSVSAAEHGGILLTNAVLGKKLKAVVTPILLNGTKGESAALITDKAVEEGSGYREAVRPNGKSVIFLAGDSTVKDYSEGAVNNSGANRVEGSWGEFLKFFTDSKKYEVIDYAEGGRSSRTFIDGTKADGSDKFLDKIKKDMGAGDYLFIQFGHNDSSADYADRYVPVGKPDADGVYPLTAPTKDGAGDGSFKWYLQQYIDAAKAVDAIPVLVTPVSRMYFNADGTIKSHHGANDEYVTAVKQLASENGIECIDMYQITKDLYEKAYKDGGETEAARLFAYGEKTHNSKLGGFILAALMANEIENAQKLGFADSIIRPVPVSAADSNGRTEFIYWSEDSFECFGKNSEGVYDKDITDEYWKAFVTKCINKLEDPSA